MRPVPAHRRPVRPSPRQRPRVGGRRGFTLIELLLVLTVLATLAAVVTPAALRMFGDYGLKQSAEAIRGDLTRARLDAVQEGVIYEFRAETNGARWVVVPGEREPAPPTELGQVPDSGDWVPVRSGTLAEGVTFTRAGSADPLGGRLEPTYFAGLPDASELSQAQWSEPIRFYPDGTAAAAAVSLTDESGGLRVVVRPVTGTASVEPLTPDVGLSDSSLIGATR